MKILLISPNIKRNYTQRASVNHSLTYKLGGHLFFKKNWLIADFKKNASNQKEWWTLRKQAEAIFGKICQFYTISVSTSLLSHVIPCVCFYFISSGELVSFSILLAGHFICNLYNYLHRLWRNFVLPVGISAIPFILSLSNEHSYSARIVSPFA